MTKLPRRLIVGQSLSRESEMSQNETAILPQASGRRDEGVNYMRQSRIPFGGALRARCGMAISKPWGSSQWRAPSSPQAVLGGRHCLQRKLLE